MKAGQGEVEAFWANGAGIVLKAADKDAAGAGLPYNAYARVQPFCE
jgi:hypothetical protein